MAIDYSVCPACNHRLTVAELNRDYILDGRRIQGVRECKRCKALFGICYKGDSYALVLPFMADGQAANDARGRERYFDFMTLGSEGIGRRHGWFDTATRKVTQIG
jgi:hypothetical protein